MAGYIPFSEKQDIVSTEIWEKWCLLNTDCQTTQEAAKMMHAVVSRLLKIDTSGTISADDFEFLVYDDDNPNAAFVEPENTKNRKPIIMISTGITKLCPSEELFAGVLAHEMGHFIWNKLAGKNQNTVFQERFSDVNAVDLLIAGRYDPVAYARLCDNLKDEPYAINWFDVHGSSFARKEDVETRLTQLHKERGNFRITEPTGLYENFVTVMSEHTDKYVPYFDAVFTQKFETEKISKDDLLDFILSEMRAGKINNSQRFKNVKDVMEQTTADGTPALDKTQRFAEEVTRLYNTGDLYDVTNFYEIRQLLEIVRRNFRNDTAFKIFPPFTEQMNVYQDFMTTRDIQHAKQLARKLTSRKKPIYWIEQHELQNLFDKPRFEMPPPESAVGYMMPTDWLVNTEDEDCINLAKMLLQTVEYPRITDAGPNNVVNNLFKGRILSISPSEIDELEDKFSRQSVYQTRHIYFRQYMDTLTMLYEFSIGKKSFADVEKFIRDNTDTYNDGSMKYGWSQQIWGRLKNAITLGDYEHENPYFEPDMNELIDSPAFTELCIKPFLQSLKQAVHIYDPKLEPKISFDKLPDGKNWVQHTTDICTQLGFRNASDKEPGTYENILELHWNDVRSPIIQLASQVVPNAIYNVFSKILQAGVAYGSFRKHDVFTFFAREQDVSELLDKFDYNPYIRQLKELEENAAKERHDDSFEQMLRYAPDSDWVYNEKLEQLIYTEFKNNKNYQFFPHMLNALDLAMPNNQKELHDVLTKPYYSFHEERKIAQQYLILYYMRQDLPLSDLKSLLKDIEETGILNIRRENLKFKYHNELTTELSYYIDRHKLMPADFESMYDIYTCMDHINFFSNETANQAKLLDAMIEQLRTKPIEQRKKYAYKLLSGFYYSDVPDQNGHVDYPKNRKSQMLQTPLAKRKLMEMYSTDIATELGHDDNSDEYLEKIKKFTDFINQQHNTGQPGEQKSRTALPQPDKSMLYRLISDKIQSQEQVSKFLNNDKTFVTSNEDLVNEDSLGRSIEVTLDFLTKNPEMAIDTIEFLNTKLTRESVTDYYHKCLGRIFVYNNIYDNTFNIAISENLYNTFWSSGLEIRAIIMNKLLNRAFDNLPDRVKFVCDMNFDKDDKYRKDAELIFDCVINAFEPYEQNLILAAVASADQNKQANNNSARSVGDGLRMFFENMGPAWVKFGQLLSYVPQLPSEIRRDLGKLKDNADIPARWDLYQDIHDALPNALYKRIERVEDIIGAGSFWVTAIIQFKGDNGKSEKKVLQLLRRNAGPRAEAGFNTIERAINSLVRRDSAYKVLKNVAVQAHESAKYEVDVDIGDTQYKKAKKMYSDIRVMIDDTTYTPRVADWRYYGTGKNGMGYKIMDYAPGATLSKVKASEDERRKMALAYFTTELTLLFQGDVWDIDRHQGQQNFNIISDNQVDINIFDTGAQLPQAPDKKNKVLLAWMFFNLIKTVQSGGSVDSCILGIIKKLEHFQKRNIDVSYVSNVQKGLMALSDIIEYQKELKDPDGHIIQERKVLSGDDLKNAVISVLHNPTVDKYLFVIIAGRYMANKLTHGEIQVLKELKNYDMFDVNNPIRIEITQQFASAHSINYDKPVFEQQDKPDGKFMGIDPRHVNANPSRGDVIKSLQGLAMAS